MTTVIGEIVWDAHACLPVEAGITFDNIGQHRRAGFDFVSVNVGMDPTGLPATIRAIAWFRACIARAPDRYRLVGSMAEIAQAKARGALAIAFDLEGADCLFERPEMVQLFADLGVRQMHLAYNLNNRVAGGCHDAPMRLTSAGHDIVRAMNRAGIVVDCSHTGRLCSFDVMAASERPVVFSHANAAALHETARNVTDDQIKACAATGGVIGICGYAPFLGRARASIVDMVSHIDHVAQLVGVDHVGLGWDHCYPSEGVPVASDPALAARYFPDATLGDHGHTVIQDTSVPIEAQSAIDLLLSAKGYGRSDIIKVKGGNFARVAAACWPVWGPSLNSDPFL